MTQPSREIISDYLLDSALEVVHLWLGNCLDYKLYEVVRHDELGAFVEGSRLFFSPLLQFLLEIKKVSGTVKWEGLGVFRPFEELVDIGDLLDEGSDLVLH